MNAVHTGRRRLGTALTIALVLQPFTLLLCQVNCVPHAAAPVAVSNAGGTACHEPVTSAGPIAKRAAFAVASVHGCNHQSAPSLKPVVETLQRAATPVLVATVAQIEVRAVTRAISLQSTHAPPGGTTSPPDVLRL